MKSFLFQILILFGLITFGQESTKEAFVNQISGTVIDSGFSKYYLSDEAKPCRFKQFDYGQLIKYSLRETVSLSVLNELATHVYEDSTDLYWVLGKIDKAICIQPDQIRSILNPTRGPRYDYSLTEKEKKEPSKK